MDLHHHFRKRWKLHHTKTWSWVKRGLLLRTICDHILGMDWRQFEMAGIRDKRNYSSDHFALRAILLQRLARCHGSYLRGRCAYILSLPSPEDLRPANRKFQDMKELKQTPPLLSLPPRPQWISETSTQLIDEHAALHHNPLHNSNVSRKLTKSVWRSLTVVYRGREVRR